MNVNLLPGGFTVCQLPDLSGFDSGSDAPDAVPFFLARTGSEISLVCRTTRVPRITVAREDGWSLFRVEGPLDFGLVGILSSLTGTLAAAGIPVFAVSTFDTDYLLVHTDRLTETLTAWRAAGHRVEEDLESM
jgi:hypothetical protein